MKLTAGADLLLGSNRGSPGSETVDLRVTSVTADLIGRAAASDGILLREESGSAAREIRLSTQGLSEALKAIPERCGSGKV